MNKLRGRLIFDLVLTIMLVFEMFFQLTGDYLHELIGITFFATIIVHLILSRKWIGMTADKMKNHKRLKGNHLVRLVLGILLGVFMVMLMASSIAISNVILDATGVLVAGSAYATWVVIHNFAAYALCVVTAVHLAVHWSSVVAAFKIPYNPERRAAVNVGVAAVAAVTVFAIGSAGAGAISAVTSQGESDSSSSDIKSSYDNLTVSSNSSSSGTTSTPVGSTSSTTSSSAGTSASSTSGTSSSSAGSTSSSSSGTSSSSSSSTTVTGNCTLCSKHCPLSNPKCNKPYAAGLI